MFSLLLLKSENTGIEADGLNILDRGGFLAFKLGDFLCSARGSSISLGIVTLISISMSETGQPSEFISCGAWQESSNSMEWVCVALSGVNEDML
jgi:hypothetical protein